MKSKYLILLTWLLPSMMVAQTPSIDIDAYYKDLEGLSGKKLFDAVCTAVNKGFDQMSYGDLWTAYKETDLYPTDSIGKAGMIWDIYSDYNFPFGKKQCGTYHNEGDCYNREHSIPKSWFCDCTSGMGADIMHLFPTDGKVNGMRSNYAYGEVSSASYTSHQGDKLGSAKMISVDSTLLGKNVTIENIPSKVFEPLNCYKGDLARAYMGTMCKWTSKYKMNDGDGKWFFTNNYTEQGRFGFNMYGLALLMKWSRQDPISRKEIDRNNGIQKTQGNRNPFVDLPELAEYIWGKHAGEAFYIQAAPSALEEVKSPAPTTNPVKVVINGRIVIRHNNQYYDLLGKEL